MRIEFEKISAPYRYPVSAADVKQILAECVSPKIMSRLVKLHFGCNQQTTQEARIVERGSSFDVRINFCPKDGKTRLLSKKQEWCEIVSLCGGSIDKKGQSVTWRPDAARKYTIFLIAHEIAHIAYTERNGFDGFKGPKSSTIEESWCDSFAKSVLAKSAVVT